MQTKNHFLRKKYRKTPRVGGDKSEQDNGGLQPSHRAIKQPSLLIKFDIAHRGCEI